METLPGILSESMRAYGPREFLGVKKDGAYRYITYAEFGQRVDAVRAGFAAIGLGKGDRVAVIADNSIPWAVCAFASYGLGAWYVPMYEAQASSDWEFIVGDCEAKVVLVRNARIATAFAGVAGKLKPHTLVVMEPDGPLPAGALTLDGVIEKGKGKPVPQATFGRDEIASLIYTSGTTGKPKGVMLSHWNIVSNILAIREVFPADPAGETSLAFLPWAHVYGQTCELFSSLAFGGRTALAESPATLIANLSEVKPTILFSVPRVWNKVYGNLNQKMVDAGGAKKALFDRAVAIAKARAALAEGGKSSAWLNLQAKVLDKLVFSKVRAVLGGNLKYACSGAAALSPEVAKFISYLGITVCEGYGLTETSPVATNNRPGEMRIGSVGRPVPGVKIEILPTDGAPAGQGEIVVVGPNVMKGYYKRDDETAKVMLDGGKFRTGDLGRIDADGYLHITGRVKEQYKLENGKYVAPAPLEEALKLSPYIGQVFIHGANRPHNVALVVPNIENLPKWAEKNGLGGKTMQQLCEEPKVRELIKSEMTRLSGDFKGYERVVDFALLPEEFSGENGCLTPTLKIKRNVVGERFGAQIAALYANPSSAAAAG